MLLAMPDASVAVLFIVINLIVLALAGYKVFGLSKSLRERELQVVLLESQLEKAMANNAQVYRPNYDDLVTLVNLDRHTDSGNGSRILMLVLLVAVFIAMAWTVVILYQGV